MLDLREFRETVRHAAVDIRTGVYSTWWLIAVLIAVGALVVMYTSIRTGVPRETWATVIKIFWSSGRLAAVGAAIIVAHLGGSWLLPAALLALATDPVVAVSLPIRRLQLFVLLGLTTSVLALELLTLPVVATVWLSSGTAQVGILAAFLASPTVVLLKLGKAFYQRWHAKRQPEGEPRLPRIYEPGARPRKGWQINLDIGAVAPRIGAVVDGLQRWSAFFEASAPTSVSIWGFIREQHVERDEQKAFDALAKAGAPRMAIRSLRKSAWRGADRLRKTIAEMLNVEPDSVFFVSNTTRAIEIGLQASAVDDTKNPPCEAPAPRVVYYPSLGDAGELEHGSELGRLKCLKRLYGTELAPVDLRDALSGEVVEDVASNIADLLVSAVRDDKRTPRSLLVSHVTHAGGWIMPIDKIVSLWGDGGRDFALIVDGAHAVGQIQVPEVGKPDLYVFSGHKWLLGPAAIGVCVLRREGVSKQVRLRYESLVQESLAWWGKDPDFEEAGTVPLDAMVGLTEALSVMHGSSLPVEEHLRDVREVFRQRSQRREHIEVIGHKGLRQAHGVLVLQKKGSWLSLASLREVVQRLERLDKIVVKVVERPLPSVAGAIRVCLPFYLSLPDIDYVVLRINRRFGEQT